MLPKIYSSVSIEQLKQDPFTVLFLAALKQRPAATFKARLAFLSDFLEGLEQADHTMEDVLNGHNWMTIGCLFTAMATVGVAITIPVLAPVAVASVIGALGAGGSQVQHSTTHKPIHDRLKRTHELLKQRPLEDWAALWEVAGSDELFASAIATAEWNFQKGINFATTQAINRIGHELGTHPSIVAEGFKQVRSGFTQTAIPPRPANVPPDAPRYIPDPQPVKITTQLGEPSALPVAHVTVSDVPSQTVANWQDTKAQVTINYAQQMRAVIDRNNSFYIGGSKGSGKGMFAANLLRWKLDQYPNAIAFVLDPKDDAKEAGYWEHPRIKRFAFRGIALNKAAYAVKVAEFLSQARTLVSQADVARGMRLFLVFDELLTLKTKLDKPIFDELASFGAEAISTGDSAGIHVIAITQSFNAGDSFGSDEVLKNFTQVGLFREDEYMRAKKQVNQNRTNASLEQAGFNQLVKQSPVKRVMQIAGDFIPTPRLENYSAYDRDSGQIIKPMPLGSSPSEGDLLAEQLRTEVAKRSTTTAASPAQSPESSVTHRDHFEQFAASLTHESQASLKAFVLWLSKRKGQEITFDQIKDSFARNAGVSRSKEAIDPLLRIAILQKLIEVLPNSNWRVRGD